MQSDTQSKKTLSAADLAQFTGSEQFFRHSLNRSVSYSEGAQYLAEHAGPYWLLPRWVKYPPASGKTV